MTLLQPKKSVAAPRWPKDKVAATEEHNAENDKASSSGATEHSPPLDSDSGTSQSAIEAILIYPHKVLRRKAKPIELPVINTSAAGTNSSYTVPAPIKAKIKRMQTIMQAANGIGLAAPQIGLSQQLIVVNVPPPAPDGESAFTSPASTTQQYQQYGEFALINPRLITCNETLSIYPEGCLSLPGLTVEVARPELVTVEFINLDGERQTVAAYGLLAICLQHELDHLHGKLIIDYLSRIKRMRTLAKWNKEK